MQYVTPVVQSLDALVFGGASPTAWNTCTVGEGTNNSCIGPGNGWDHSCENGCSKGNFGGHNCAQGSGPTPNTCYNGITGP